MPIKLNAKVGNAIPDQPVVLGEIKKMTDRYRSKMLKRDAKSCWVSKAEIDALMKDNKANGMRIYYGRHADNDGNDFKKKHNVILVATIDSVSPEKPTSENSDDQLNAFAENGPVNSVIASFEGMGDDVIPLCPPHCPKNPSVLSPKE